jgi:SAM-dependent methyltransferase
MNSRDYYSEVRDIVEAEQPCPVGQRDRKHSWLQRLHTSQSDTIPYLLEAYLPLRRVLDVGCGPLTLLRKFSPNAAAELYGIDIVEYGIWREHANIRSIVADVDKGGLPFRECSFDAVIMSATLEHLFDPFAAVEEASRVLVDGGLFVVLVPNIAYVKQRISLLLGRLPITSTEEAWDRRSWDGHHLHYFNLSRLTWLVETYGHMKTIRVIGSGRFAKLRSVWPAALTGDLVLLARKVAG